MDVLTLGTFTIELERGTIGTATTDVCTVADSPVDLVYGTNTITTEVAIGNIVVDVELVSTQTVITDTIAGTAFDVSALATTFGLSTMMLSGIIWLLMSVLICGATYKVVHRPGGYGGEDYGFCWSGFSTTPAKACLPSS